MKNRPFLIRNMKPDDLPQIKALQERYLNCYPGALTPPVEVYQSPGFAEGENIFCCVLPDGRLIGYAPLMPALVDEMSQHLPHILWMEIKVDPELPQRENVRGALLDSLIRRGSDLAQSNSRRSTHLVFQYFPFEDEAIDFLFKRGFVHTESVFTLKRDLSLPIPSVLMPPGMKLQACSMETEAEQIAYVQARNSAFPESPITLEDWQYFTRSPLWQVGTCLAVFDGDELAGSIALYWDEAQNQVSGRRVGWTEHLFVLPRWRGLGLGRYLVAQGLIHLKKHALQEAQLEVKAANEGALGLYTKLGYQVARESWFLVNTL